MLEGLARTTAPSGGPKYYGDGYRRFGYNPESHAERDKFHAELGECSRCTYAKHGFMISALIVRSDGSALPGEGFFALARELGEAVGSDESDRSAFFSDQLRKVLEHYKK